MTAKAAWNKLITHCRWLGIPISHSDNKFVTKINEQDVQVLATSNYRVEWEKNFNGAWSITLYFPEKGKITWARVATLVHEIGHVINYRDNMIITSSTILQNERKDLRI